jgi:tetratricopeptide (TPR) repeat protein
MSLRWIVAAGALLVAGCADDLVRRESDNHFAAAHRFDLQGDYVSAREQYWKALVDARQSGATPATISMLTYNFGRTTGYTCHLEEAEKYLLEALEMEKAISGPESGISTKRLFELARFYFDQGNFDKSVGYYDSGIPAIKKLGIAESDPITLANVLDEYSEVLASSGRGAEVAAIRQEAVAIRAANPGRQARFTPVRFRCNHTAS